MPCFNLFDLVNPFDVSSHAPTQRDAYTIAKICSNPNPIEERRSLFFYTVLASFRFKKNMIITWIEEDNALQREYKRLCVILSLYFSRLCFNHAHTSTSSQESIRNEREVKKISRDDESEVVELVRPLNQC